MKFTPVKISAFAFSLLLALLLLPSRPDAGGAFAQSVKTNVKAKSDTAKPDMHACSAAEKSLLDEINLVRTRPQQYASYLEQLKPHYSGINFQPPGKTVMRTAEGWKAVEEAITALRAAKPAPALNASVGMCCGAVELTKDQKASGRTGHQGSDGGYCEQRVERFGSWTAPIGENLSYGNIPARERVTLLLIDDGVSSRNHRKRLLDTSFKVAGIACDDHSTEGMLCVITLAGGFKEKLASGPPAAAAKPGAKIPAGAKRF